MIEIEKLPAGTDIETLTPGMYSFSIEEITLMESRIRASIDVFAETIVGKSGKRVMLDMDFAKLEKMCAKYNGEYFTPIPQRKHQPCNPYYKEESWQR